MTTQERIDDAVAALSDRGYECVQRGHVGEPLGLTISDTQTAELRFEWSGRGHTVNIFRFGNEVDVLSSGSFANDHATPVDVLEHVLAYLKGE